MMQHFEAVNMRRVLCKRVTAVVVAFATVVGTARVASGAVKGRYILFGNALSEKMGLVEVEVYSGGKNVVLGRPEVFTRGLDYGYWMRERDPQQYAKLLVDGDNDTTKRKVDFGSKISCSYLDMSLWYSSFEMDLGEEIPVDRIGIYRSRHKMKQYADLGWRYLVLLDAKRRIVAWDAFNVYGEDWHKKRGVWMREVKPAIGAPARRIVPPNKRCWLSEAEYIRDFLGKPVVDLVTAPSAEAQVRLERFKDRNSPAALRELGERFFRLVDLDRPGMDEVKRLVTAGRYADALAAFRRPFLDSTKVLQHWNAGEGTGIYNFYAWGDDQDTRATLRARDLRSHVYADRNDMGVKRFVPGLLPPAKMKFPFQTRPLLLSYAANKTVKDLREWEALTDDWAMGFQDAADQDPTLREHFVLTVNVINQTCKDLYNADRTNPKFATEVSGATIARLLLPIITELPVGYWRVTRKCVFNHNFNAVAQAFLASQVLADFHVGQRLEREVSQALQRLHTLAQYRDGPMVETCDEGHFVMNMISPANLYSMLATWRPGWFTPAVETYFLDNYRQAILAGVRHVSPSGAPIRWPGGETGLGYLDYYLGTNDPYWRNVNGVRMTWGDYYPVLAKPVMKEPDPRAIVDTVFGRGRNYADSEPKKLKEQEAIAKMYGGEYQGLPSIISDWIPYTGGWYFRGGWEREDAFLHMLNPALGNSHNYGHYRPTQAYQFFWDTSYRFQDYATNLLTTFAVDIDGLMMCPLDETRFFSGSKQDTFTQAVEKPQPLRWHTGPRFDFGEAVYEGIYRNITRGKDEEAGERKTVRSETSVRGVRTVRQIFQVRPARMFLAVDRLKYATDAEQHTNRVQVHFLLTEPGEETGKNFSDQQFRLSAPAASGLKQAAMRNPGNPGATITWFGQPDLTLRRLSVNATSHHYWRTPDPELETSPKDQLLFGPFPNFNGPRKTSGRGVFAIWEGTGETVLLSTIISNRPGEEPIQSMQDISTDTYAGIQAETTGGVRVTLLVARRIPARLSAGALTLDGEALLWVEQPNHAPAGIVLGAKNITARHRTETLPSADFAFTLEPANAKLSGTEGGLRTTPIRKPIDPPTVRPAVNTFTDSTEVTLTSATPDVEIYYSTDGSDPTPKSQCYRRPFVITEDTFIKARAFRPGVEDAPFTAAGTEVSAVSYGSFFKRPLKPAIDDVPSDLEPGLGYDYLEGRWFGLWAHTDRLPAKKTGTTAHLLDVGMRENDGPFAIRYHGYIDIPESGVYTFYGPHEYINNCCAPGYDLRLYIDHEEWYLGQIWHGRGMWSVPLEQGIHRFKLTFADARAKDIENQRIDLWNGYPQSETTWRGVAPELELSGPNLEKQPIPDTWFRH